MGKFLNAKLAGLFLLVGLAALTSEVSAQNNSGPKWRQCAQEGGVCVFNGSRKVAYGAANRYVTYRFDGGAYCNSRAFGQDPVPNVVKACYIDVNEQMAAQSTPGGRWVKCGVEGQTCNVSGRRRIAFGNGSEWVFWDAEGSFPCRPANPVNIARGKVRSCFYDATNAVQAPLPAGVPAGSRLCAKEGQNCTMDRARKVFYGANGRYRTRVMAGTFLCDSNMFGGDPYPGIVKACYTGTE